MTKRTPERNARLAEIRAIKKARLAAWNSQPASTAVITTGFLMPTAFNGK